MRYLQMSNRLRERDTWVQWLKDAVTREGFTKEAADYEREHAWTRFTQGDPRVRWISSRPSSSASAAPRSSIPRFNWR